MRVLSQLSVAVAALSPTLALAHPGEHHGSFFHGLGHVLTEPDHLAMVCALAAVIGVGAWLRRALSKRNRAGKNAAATQRD